MRSLMIMEGSRGRKRAMRRKVKTCGYHNISRMKDASVLSTTSYVVEKIMGHEYKKDVSRRRRIHTQRPFTDRFGRPYSCT